MPKAYGFTEYGGPETQDLLDVPTPTPGPGEMRVAVHAAGVNPVDRAIRAGYLREAMPLDLPAVLGREVAGVVREIGQDVDGFAVGDEVLGAVAPGSGGWAEEALVVAAETAKKPTGLSFTDAAALPIAAATARSGLDQIGLDEGRTVLIVGIGGGVGVVAAQIARDRGLNVVGVGSEEKRELAESLGATLVTYDAGSVADRVRAILPDGVDGILDLVGGDALRDVAGLVGDPARIVSAADPATAAELGGRAVERDSGTKALGVLAHLVADGKLDPHVTDVVPLDEAGQAMAAVESGHSRGKVVIGVA